MATRNDRLQCTWMTSFSSVHICIAFRLLRRGNMKLHNVFNLAMENVLKGLSDKIRDQLSRHHTQMHFKSNEMYTFSLNHFKVKNIAISSDPSSPFHCHACIFFLSFTIFFSWSVIGVVPSYTNALQIKWNVHIQFESLSNCEIGEMIDRFPVYIKTMQSCSSMHFFFMICDWGSPSFLCRRIFFILMALDLCLLLIHRDLWNSQKCTIIYLNNNSESEYLKKRNKFLSIILSEYFVF
jgi:hypothetical protein